MRKALAKKSDFYYNGIRKKNDIYIFAIGKRKLRRKEMVTFFHLNLSLLVDFSYFSFLINK